ncbi:MAG: hypothetical protein KDK70_00265 [Myxococcales bacterium]|nr:hypothetical protein [Myxococcales bacterium]
MSALPDPPVAPVLSARRLNAECHCLPVDPARVEALRRQLSLTAAAALTPTLFAMEPVFVSRAEVEAIERSVAALHACTREPAYRARALARAPAIAADDFGPDGVFMAYDFHLGDDGPQLIEVNTNGGGALLHARLHGLSTDAFMEMFRAEWAAQRGDAPLGTVAIVDDRPWEQPMLPEFELFAGLFEAAGLRAVIADPGELTFDGQLRHQGHPVDLVYNRLTDFYLEAPRSDALHRAHRSGAVVVTPHPRAHALHADKRNLVDLDVPGVPECRAVEASQWSQRRQWYFKPAGSHGSRGVYRGAKLTRARWTEVLTAGDYVAQREVPPPRRTVLVGGQPHELKFDVRAFAYRGRVQLLTARIYQGQTTNLRTPGGGFAPVVIVPR